MISPLLMGDKQLSDKNNPFLGKSKPLKFHLNLNTVSGSFMMECADIQIFPRFDDPPHPAYWKPS